MTYNYNNSLLGDYLTPSGNNLVVENPIIISSGSINNTIIGNNIASSGNFSSLTVNNTGVSLIGHSHLSSDITNFNSSVSGLLPSVTGTGYISSSFINNIYTLSASGLQPSGNYAASSHVHTSSDVTDFNSSVSGLLPVKNVTGSGYVGVSSVSGVYSVSVSGLQPSGNYAASSHTHTSSDVTDFNSSVSGLLPTISNSGNNRILTSTGTSTGINAETNLSFSDTELSITATNAIPEVSLITYTNGTSRGRINAIRYFNTIENPTIGSGIVTGTTQSLISQIPNISGVLSTVTAIRQQLAGDIIGNINRPTRISFSTSSGAEEALDNTLSLTDEGGLLHDGYMIIDDGLSAPTPITNLGTVSGNVSISYNFDKQIQTLILNGTNTNFIEGSGWPSATSVDVLLEITVTSTTSVTWTIVDDWYNPAPSLLVGKYLVLLRSMGTTIQAHYISKKTN